MWESAACSCFTLQETEPLRFVFHFSLVFYRPNIDLMMGKTGGLIDNNHSFVEVYLKWLMKLKFPILQLNSPTVKDGRLNLCTGIDSSVWIQIEKGNTEWFLFEFQFHKQSRELTQHDGGSSDDSDSGESLFVSSSWLISNDVFSSCFQLEVPGLSSASMLEVGPVGLSFELPKLTVTGLQIRFLRLSPIQPGPSQRWVRYVTHSDSYTIRI